jgi:hypothetical protein
VKAAAMAALERPWATSASTSRSPWAQGSQGACAAAGAQQVADDLGIENGAALSHPHDRVNEVADVCHAVLQQVAHALGSRKRGQHCLSLPWKRYRYVYALFSTNGFTEVARELALARPGGQPGGPAALDIRT